MKMSESEEGKWIKSDNKRNTRRLKGNRNTLIKATASCKLFPNPKSDEIANQVEAFSIPDTFSENFADRGRWIFYHLGAGGISYLRQLWSREF